MTLMATAWPVRLSTLADTGGQWTGHWMCGGVCDSPLVDLSEAATSYCWNASACALVSFASGVFSPMQACLVYSVSGSTAPPPNIDAMSRLWCWSQWLRRVGPEFYETIWPGVLLCQSRRDEADNLIVMGVYVSFASVTESAGKPWYRQASNDTAMNREKRGVGCRVDMRSSLRVSRMSWHAAAAETGYCLAMQCEPLLLTRAPALLMSAEHCPPLRPDRPCTSTTGSSHRDTSDQHVCLTATSFPRAKICDPYSYENA
jgi:hypothetical protein